MKNRKITIELITGTKLTGFMAHLGHKHPKDKPEDPERKNWHYYKDEETGELHHLRGEHIVRVTEH